MKTEKLFLLSLAMLSLGIFIGTLLKQGVPSSILNQNGTFVLNGTDEWYYLQYMNYNKNQLINFYDLQQVIIGNFCKEKYGNYITDITPQSFRLQCCQNFTSCKNYVIINKNIEEVKLR